MKKKNNGIRNQENIKTYTGKTGMIIRHLETGTA